MRSHQTRMQLLQARLCVLTAQLRLCVTVMTSTWCMQTPAGTDINRVGISPDVELETPYVAQWHHAYLSD